MAESSRRCPNMKKADSPAVGSAGGVQRIDQLPPEIITNIMTKLDVPSICATSITCKVFRNCAAQSLKVLQTFHLEIAAPIDHLRRFLPPNPLRRSLTLECKRLSDSAIDCLLQPGLQELSLRHCMGFSGKLLAEVGRRCRDLRSLYVSSVGDIQGHTIDVPDLEELLRGCTQLEALVLMFDVRIVLHPRFNRIWSLASPTITHLEIGCIPQLMFREMLNPTIEPNPAPNPNPTPNLILPQILPNIQKLYLSVDCISNIMVKTISDCLVLLTHLDLRDQPILEPRLDVDLSDVGLRLVNRHGRLKHLSLVRSQEFNPHFFRRVTDQGILFMADKSECLESICLGGFYQVTDTGFKTLLHSCGNLRKLQVFNGTRMTDLVFHDMFATPLTLELVSLRRCNLLTDSAIMQLAVNLGLTVLDLRDSRNLGDKALQAISKLPKLMTLLLDGTDVTDAGLSFLKKGEKSTLVKLSVRGCARLTDKCISSLFKGGSNKELRELDLSNLPNFSNAGVQLLVKNRIPLVDLRMRQCPLIGDMSVMALASMTMDDEERWHGGSLRRLDIYNCGGITQLSFRWLKKPYFPGLRWLGVGGYGNHNLADSLSMNRPFLHLVTGGQELGTDRWDNLDDIYVPDDEEVDELEQWIFQDDGNMTDADGIDLRLSDDFDAFDDDYDDDEDEEDLLLEAEEQDDEEEEEEEEEVVVVAEAVVAAKDDA